MIPLIMEFTRPGAIRGKISEDLKHVDVHTDRMGPKRAEN
jgi:hypothetical protein